jgi:GTPase SAR1 family protein
VTVTILGSKGVGKTAMILSQIQDEFIAPEQYDSFLAPRTADGTLVFKKNYFVTKNSWVITMLEPDVTGVVKEMTRVKPAIRSCLARSDAVILAFNVADEQSIDDVTTLWGPQLREVYGPHVPPVILLGLQTDLRGTHMTFTAK